MGALLGLTGFLLLISGATKLRSARRAGLRVAGLTLAELLLAVIAAALAVGGPNAWRIGVWLVPVGVGLVVVSSILHAGELGEARRSRADTEGGRLQTYVKYLSKLEGPPGPEA